MAKDPAMLWYWNDWNSGTALMSRFLKGAYMDLLHAQFNHGRLSLEEIKTCLGSDFGNTWPALQKKFKQEENLFFNERLEYEKNRRAAFTESRRQSRLGKVKETYDTTYEKHTLPRMENVNVNTNLSSFSKGVEGENLFTTHVTHFHNDFRFIEKFCRDKNIREPDIKARMREFISDLELKEDYKDLKELKRHFTNWFNKNNNGIKNTYTGGNKQDATAAFIRTAKAEFEHGRCNDSP